MVVSGGVMSVSGGIIGGIDVVFWILCDHDSINHIINLVLVHGTMAIVGVFLS